MMVATAPRMGDMGDMEDMGDHGRCQRRDRGGRLPPPAISAAQPHYSIVTASIDDAHLCSHHVCPRTSPAEEARRPPPRPSTPCLSTLHPLHLPLGHTHAQRTRRKGHEGRAAVSHPRSHGAAPREPPANHSKAYHPSWAVARGRRAGSVGRRSLGRWPWRWTDQKPSPPRCRAVALSRIPPRISRERVLGRCVQGTTHGS